MTIIGAGFSGHAAARKLAQYLDEALPRVGGRTLMDKVGANLGCAYFGPTQDGIIFTQSMSWNFNFAK